MAMREITPKMNLFAKNKTIIKMKKNVISIIIFLICLNSFSQIIDESNKKLVEEYRWVTGFQDTTISINTFLQIRDKFPATWLHYIMTTHPEYDKNDLYRKDIDMYKDQYQYVLGDTIEPGKHRLYFTIKKWPELDKPLGIPYNAERITPYKNYYLIEKKRNIFIDYCADTSLGCKTDTIEVDAQSKYYPFDERFLVYYDPVNAPRQPRWLSGNVHWNTLPEYPFNYNWECAPLIRLAQYGVERLRLYHSEYPSRASNNFTDKLKYQYYIAEKSLLTDGYLWIRTPYISDDSQYEMIYFTNRPEKTGDTTRMTMRKYHYTIKTGWHEDIRERYPVITDYKVDSPEFIRDFVETPFRLKYEGQQDLIELDEYEDDPLDVKKEEEE